MTCCPSPNLNPSKVVSVVEWILAACFAQENQLAAGRHIAAGRHCSRPTLRQSELCVKTGGMQSGGMQSGGIAAGHKYHRATFAAGRHCSRANLQASGAARRTCSRANLQQNQLAAGRHCSRATLRQSEFAGFRKGQKSISLGRAYVLRPVANHRRPTELNSGQVKISPSISCID